MSAASDEKAAARAFVVLIAGLHKQSVLRDCCVMCSRPGWPWPCMTRVLADQALAFLDAAVP
jgi:hypothetical protein